MKHFLQISFLTMFVLLLSCEPSVTEQAKKPQEPQNIGVLTLELLDYYNSGTYMKQADSVAALAMDFLNAQNGSLNGQVLVLDIDDTSVTNGEVLAKTRFCQTAEWLNWMVAGKAPAISGVHAVYEKAKTLGMKVIFITARDEGLKDATENNLKFAGYDTYDSLVFKLSSSNFPTSAAFKTAMRKAITEDGQTILLNIGDQESDTSGGFATKAFKLPNPFYFTR